MNLNQKLQDLLENFTETEVLEFKEAKMSYDFNKLGQYFSALSNEANLKGLACAWLVFGVKDNKEIVGSQFRLAEKDLQGLKREVANKTTGRLTFLDIHVVEHSEGRVILFEIPAAPQGIPIAWNGHYYGRDGESLGPLNIDEIERIRQQNVLKDWSAAICEGASLDDLSEEALIVARQKYLTKNPGLAEELAEWDDLTFLNKSKVTIQGKLTRTAILLLGKPEATHWLSPSSATISWILKDRDGLEKDYQHFSCPLLLSTSQVFHKVRNLKYRYMPEGTLFPEEVDQYDPYIIREALNNAIAHQDYELGGKISLVEFEDGRLCFSNQGKFIPGSVEEVIYTDAPESRYRNRFLTDAMVNLNMIDTIGSGIKKMFIIQKNRLFPLPEYELQANRVQVTITGRVVDMNYARKLAEIPELTLADIMLLDRLQKQKTLTPAQASHLKKQGLIEGRKPNYYISAKVASHSNRKADYIRIRGFNDQHYKQMILDYLSQFASAKRSDINQLILDKLPGVLDKTQKDNKVKNILQSLKKEGLVDSKNRIWHLSKPQK